MGAFATVYDPDHRHGTAVYVIHEDGVYPLAPGTAAGRCVSDYAVRGGQWFPTAHNRRDAPGVPTFIVIGTLIYPTEQNPRGPVGLPFYELRDPGAP